MSVVEDTRKVLQDFLAPELRASNAKLDGIDRRIDDMKVGIDTRIDELQISIDRRFDDLSKQNAADKLENLRMIEGMIRELSLRIDLAITKSRLAKYEGTEASKEAPQ